MTPAVSFTVTLDDLIDSRRLATRRIVVLAASVFALVGLVFRWAGSETGMWLSLLFAAFTVVAWRFPVVDRLLMRRRAAARIGALCEVWLDERGVAYRQAGVAGHIAWSAITLVDESGDMIVLRQGGIALLAIPRRAFSSDEGLAVFVRAIRRNANDPTR